MKNYQSDLESLVETFPAMKKSRAKLVIAQKASVKK